MKLPRRKIFIKQIVRYSALVSLCKSVLFDALRTHQQVVVCVNKINKDYLEEKLSPSIVQTHTLHAGILVRSKPVKSKGKMRHIRAVPILGRDCS